MLTRPGILSPYCLSAWVRLHEPPPMGYPGISPKQQLPGDLERPQGSLRPLALTSRKSENCSFWAERRKKKTLPPAKGPEKSATNRAKLLPTGGLPSNLLWYIPTVEGLFQMQAMTNSRRTSSYIRAHALWMPPV